jgi:hypothetical protein
MDTILLNIASIAHKQLSTNSTVSLSSTNINLACTRSSVHSISNKTAYTGDRSNITIPDLCSLLDEAFDCANTSIVMQVF